VQTYQIAYLLKVAVLVAVVVGMLLVAVVVQQVTESHRVITALVAVAGVLLVEMPKLVAAVAEKQLI
jgi:hypothetical protein